MAGFQRVINIFMDKQVTNSDTVTPLVVLGKTYDNVSKTYDDFVVVSSNKNLNNNGNNNSSIQDQKDSKCSTITHRSSPDTADIENKDIVSAVNDFKEKFSSNFASFFSPKNDTLNSNDKENLFDSQAANNETNSRWPDMFLKDVQTRAWLTYRGGFEPIPKDPNSPSNVFSALIRGNFSDINSEGFSTDAGWGCMIRTSQTLLANALLSIHLGRDWCFDSTRNNAVHDMVMSWFMDVPDAPFSIHKFVKKGQMCGKSSGEWFGPSAASISIQSLCNEFENAKVNVFIGEHSGEIYETDLLKCFKKNATTDNEIVQKKDNGENEEDLDDDSKTPVLILLGIRLGIDNVNRIYYSGLKKLLSLPETVGIAGGRPSSSYYFFGYQGDNLFYLDPHVFYKQALTKENFDLQSLHTTSFHKLNLSDMDPSMLIGLIVKDEAEWFNLKKSMNEDRELNKIIHVIEGSKADFNDAINCDIDDFEEESYIYDEEEEGVKVAANDTANEEQGVFILNNDKNINESKTNDGVIAI